MSVGSWRGRHRVFDVTAPVASIDHRHQLAVQGGVAAVVQSIASYVGSVAGAVVIYSISGSSHNGVCRRIAAHRGVGRIVLSRDIGRASRASRGIGRAIDRQIFCCEKVIFPGGRESVGGYRR